MSTVEDELATLSNSLREYADRAQALAADPTTAGPESTDINTEIGRVLAELGQGIAQQTENLEETVAAHPLGSVAASFLLGVLVGRLTAKG